MDSLDRIANLDKAKEFLEKIMLLLKDEPLIKKEIFDLYVQIIAVLIPLKLPHLSKAEIADHFREMSGEMLLEALGEENWKKWYPNKSS